MAAEVNKELNNIIECSICTEVFTEPRMLPCIHTFCVKCLSETGLKTKKRPGDKMPCPLCRTEFTVPMDGFTGLQKNFFMDKLVEVIQSSSKQNACDLNTGKCSSVKWYCHECRQKLCDKCFRFHKEIKTQKHHNLVPFDDQTDSEKLMEFCNRTVCDQHETEELKVFCDECQVVQCALCFLERHQSHKWSYVKEVANKFRTQIASNADMLSGSVPEAQRIIEQLDKDNIEFLETVIKIESEVNEKKLRIKALFDKMVDEEAKSLLLQLSSYKRAKSKESEIEKEDIDGHLTKLNSYIMFCSEITAKGSDVDICRAANELNSRAKELKESHGTVMQRKPALCRRPISFDERKSEDFLKTCGNLLGKIEVPKEEMDRSLQNSQDITPGNQINMPIQRMMPAPVAQPGMPQKLSTEAVARPPMHVGEPTQRPQFVSRQQSSNIFYYDPGKTSNYSGTDVSHAVTPKAKNVLAIIDPTTGQNVLETLETSSPQTSNEALKIHSEFAHKVSQRISLGTYSALDELTQPLYGARRKDLLAVTLDKKQEKGEDKIQQKSPEKTEDKAKERSKEDVPEKTQEKMQANRQEVIQGPIPVDKKPLIEKKETQQNAHLVAAQLHLKQEVSKGSVSNLMLSILKEEKIETPIPYVTRSQMMEFTEHPTGTTSPITDLLRKDFYTYLQVLVT